MTLTVINYCTLPFVRLLAHCIEAETVIAAKVASPNPVTIGFVIHLFLEIYENF